MTDEKDDRVTLDKTTDDTVAGGPEEKDGSTAAETSAADASVSDVASDPKASYLPHIAIGLSVVALVFAVLVGWLAYGTVQQSAAETARTEARVAAEEQAVAMLAYTHNQVDA